MPGRAALQRRHAGQGHRHLSELDLRASGSPPHTHRRALVSTPPHTHKLTGSSTVCSPPMHMPSPPLLYTAHHPAHPKPHASHPAHSHPSALLCSEPCWWHALPCKLPICLRCMHADEQTHAAVAVGQLCGRHGAGWAQVGGSSGRPRAALPCPRWPARAEARACMHMHTAPLGGDAHDLRWDVGAPKVGLNPLNLTRFSCTSPCPIAAAKRATHTRTRATMMSARCLCLALALLASSCHARGLQGG